MKVSVERILRELQDLEGWRSVWLSRAGANLDCELTPVVSPIDWRGEDCGQSGRQNHLIHRCIP